MCEEKNIKFEESFKIVSKNINTLIDLIFLVCESISSGLNIENSSKVKFEFELVDNKERIVDRFFREFRCRYDTLYVCVCGAALAYINKYREHYMTKIKVSMFKRENKKYILLSEGFASMNPIRFIQE